MVPFVNLEAQYQKIKSEILVKIEEVLDSRAFIQGKYVQQFEQEFVALHQAQFGVGCSNGTSAISVALEALGIGKGDEVITVVNTFFATAEAICNTGAKPVFVDMDPITHTIAVEQIESQITPRTKAIIPVHLYGNPCDMDSIMKISNQHNLFVIEDCAQAHLATYRGKFAGSFGDMATYSFYPGKNLGAYGDAGIVLTKTEEHEKLLRKLVNHGRLSKYEHDMIGYNHRMDGLQGAVLSVKLKYLEKWTANRRNAAQRYDQLLSKIGVQRVQPTEGSEPVYHLYVVEVENRKEVVSHLKSSEIGSGIHYPIPLHLQPALSSLGYQKGDFPIAEKAAERILSLPMCGELSEEEVEKVAGCLQELY